MNGKKWIVGVTVGLALAWLGAMLELELVAHAAEERSKQNQAAIVAQGAKVDKIVESTARMDERQKAMKELLEKIYFETKKK